MKSDNTEASYLIKPLPLYFLLGMILVNFIAVFQLDVFYIGAFFAFLYIIITPGFLLLPFLTQKKLPPMLGIAFSIALSILMLMLIGLVINAVLPLFEMMHPLATIPLLIAFDVLIYLLLTFNFIYKKNSPFEFHKFSLENWLIVFLSVLLPVFACIGAVILNNRGSNFLTMLAMALAGVLVLIIMFTSKEDDINPSIPPFALCMMALSFLLMNSMRGWFITGHDILLEYHVFALVAAAQHWSMALYQDPYMACLSLTILPTYLENLLHVSPAYIFKFFTQFIGALPVVIVYYLTKEYTSKWVAFLTGFLYISFPTFLVDMAFLNRQGIAFLFFGALVFALFTTEHFSGRKRMWILFLLGAGIIVSHYSTSYITIALLVGAYLINWILRLLVKMKWTNSLGNREMYERPILLTLPFVIGLVALMFLWSSVVTKTSTAFISTIQQIAASLNDPFSTQRTGPAKYSLGAMKQPTPQELFQQFVQDSMQKENVAQYPSVFYPASMTNGYTTMGLPEPLAPLTSFGSSVETTLRVDLGNLYNSIKQTYAKILQLLLLIGLIGLIFGYSFKKHIVHHVPVEYLAIALSGIGVLVGQTVLPGSAVDYGLLRLFQQNLIFLALPIMLGFLCITFLITRDHKKQLGLCTIVLLFFYIIFSGFFPQFTGGGRAPLTLDNYGLYYASYYTHGQEVYAARWLAGNTDRNTSIQAALFSDIKLLAYGHIGADVEVLPQTTKRDAYVYLNYDNVRTSNILEIVGGDVIYYHFPMDFLGQNKDLIYNNGGSDVYH